VISLLVPSRARPTNITHLYHSLCDCGWTEGWELLIRLDDDDDSSYPDILNTHYFRGPRTTMSVYWNELAEHASGDILWHGGDDVVFRTINWDTIVRAAFPPDDIAFVHGHDLSPNGHWLGTHGFLHRRWVDTVGYFVPPYFSSDYNDMWLVDVSDMIDRHVYIPIVTEHLHPSHGKGEWDITHMERLERHTADDMDGLYRSPEMVQNRMDDADKLRGVMS
jgi:hypothetical protein